MKSQIPTKNADSFKLPVLGLGTWQMGGRYDADTSRDREEIDFIGQAFEAGIRHFDTAEVYAAGHAEELLGQGLKKLPREQLFVTSKVSDNHLKSDQVISACRASLKRLGLDYLDLYLVHAPSAHGIPLVETLKAMASLYESGFIKNLGVSNFKANLLAEAQAASKYKIVNNQIHFSVGARGYEEDGTLAYCAEHGILVTAYRPVGLGSPKRSRGSFGEDGWNMLSEIAGRYQKTAVQIALNWIVSQVNTVALVRTANVDHLKENLGSLDFQLSTEDLIFLQDKFPRIATMYPTPSQRA